MPVEAMDFAAPQAPRAAQKYLPKEAESFGQGLWNVLRLSAKVIAPEFAEAVSVCVRCFAGVLLVGLVGECSSGVPRAALGLASVAGVAVLLLEPSAALLDMGVDLVKELRDYGNLLLPVMAGAMAAQGGVTTGASLYVGTAVFDAVLSWAASKVMIPMVYCYLAFAVGNAALEIGLLARLRSLIGKVMEWAMKAFLTVFTTYMALTGVVSGAADATAAKAAKLAISSGIPVVGGILSDAAEAVLLSAGTLAGSAGVWGILTILALAAAPAMKLGAQVLLLRGTAALCSAAGEARGAMLVGDFATALGMLLALVGTQCVMLLISTVCFLQGVRS